MKSTTLALTALISACLAIGAAAAQPATPSGPMDNSKGNGAMSGGAMGMSGPSQAMSKDDMMMAKNCMAMPHDKMMADTGCQTYMKAHPDGMKGH